MLQEDTFMAQAAEPPSGTRDFLADDVRRRKAAFDTIGVVFERYGFDPLETPAFERLTPPSAAGSGSPKWTACWS